MRNLYNLKSLKMPNITTVSTSQVKYWIIHLEPFGPLRYILEVFPLSVISLHMFCYFHLEFVYQNFLYITQLWDSTKTDYCHSLQHMIFAVFTFPYSFIREIIMQNISSEFLSVCSFRCKRNQPQTIAKEKSVSTYHKKMPSLNFLIFFHYIHKMHTYIQIYLF